MSETYLLVKYFFDFSFVPDKLSTLAKLYFHNLISHIDSWKLSGCFLSSKVDSDNIFLSHSDHSCLPQSFGNKCAPRSGDLLYNVFVKSPLAQREERSLFVLEISRPSL